MNNCVMKESIKDEIERLVDSFNKKIIKYLKCESFIFDTIREDIFHTNSKIDAQIVFEEKIEFVYSASESDEYDDYYLIIEKENEEFFIKNYMKIRNFLDYIETFILLDVYEEYYL